MIIDTRKANHHANNTHEKLLLNVHSETFPQRIHMRCHARR